MHKTSNLCQGELCKTEQFWPDLTDSSGDCDCTKQTEVSSRSVKYDLDLEVDVIPEANLIKSETVEVWARDFSLPVRNV